MLAGQGRLNIRFTDPPAVRARLRLLQAAFEGAGQHLTFGEIVRRAIMSVNPDRVAELLKGGAN